jgi:hypothetical protein
VGSGDRRSRRRRDRRLFESFEDDDTRLAFEGNPPEPLAEWLATRGVEL